MRTLSLLILACVIPVIAFSQSPLDKMSNDSAGKLSPALLQKVKTRNSQFRLIAGVTNTAEFKNRFKELVQVIREYNAHILIISVNSSAIGELLASPLLTFADLADRSPKEELIVSGFDLSTNGVNMLHERYPALTGENLVVSIKENRFDSTDIDLKGRVINSGIASPTASGHATIMATMVAGAGNSYYQGKGVAWRANMQSATFTNLLPEPDAFYQAQRISVQNHSYGTAIENYYGADAAAYDASVVNNPVLLHVFSSGNSGLSASNGPYTGVTGFANLTGSFKMAKNNLVVGAIDSLGNVEGPSSKGPAYDGRIKPELVAFGQDGSSGAAAIVSGIALLLQQSYAKTHQDSLAPAALVKAILINSADDVGAEGPDHASGYGSANAHRAVRTMEASSFVTNTIQQGNTDTYPMTLHPALNKFTVTLVWTDPPAQANAARALQNDLDLEIVNTTTGEIFQPWILSRAANGDSLVRAAIRGRDTLNNVEHFTLKGNVSANFHLRVKGSRVTNAQRYYLVFSFESRDQFEWRFPMSRDPVEGGTTVTLRFNSTVNFAPLGELQYSFADGNWHTIATNVYLTKKYFRWNAPDTFSTALLRMVARNFPFTSDTFVISKRINTQVGFNCPDSFLFYWNRPPGVSSFRVYKMGSKFLEPLAVTNDTFYMNAGSAVNSKQFTIAPLLKNREGIRSYTFDYTTQGTGCYFKSFLTQLVIDKAELAFEFGSLYNASRIIVQKLSGNNFQAIRTINGPVSMQYTLYDSSLQQGANIYRIALQLKDGRIIYGNTEVVYYVGNLDYVIYPNPATVTSGFRVLQKDASSIQVLLTDAAGRLVKNEIHSDLINNISTANLQKGLYVISIMKEGKRIFVGKLVVQ